MNLHLMSQKTDSIENALGTSLKVSSSKIFLLLSTLYILGRVAGKICIHLSQFSQTTALCCKNISVVLAVYTVPDAPNTKLCWHNQTDPT